MFWSRAAPGTGRLAVARGGGCRRSFCRPAVHEQRTEVRALPRLSIAVRGGVAENGRHVIATRAVGPVCCVPRAPCLDLPAGHQRSFPRWRRTSSSATTVIKTATCSTRCAARIKRTSTQPFDSTCASCRTTRLSASMCTFALSLMRPSGQSNARGLAVICHRGLTLTPSKVCFSSTVRGPRHRVRSPLAVLRNQPASQ